MITANGQINFEDDFDDVYESVDIEKEWDDQKTIKKEIVWGRYEDKSAVVAIVEYEYTEDGMKKAAYKYYDEDKATIKYEYDEKGRVKKAIRYPNDVDGKAYPDKYMEYECCEYDESGIRKSSRIYNSNDALEVSEEYGESGQLISASYYNEKGLVECEYEYGYDPTVQKNDRGEDEYSYDKDGMDGPYEKVKIEYTYDEYGNLKEKKTYRFSVELDRMVLTETEDLQMHTPEEIADSISPSTANLEEVLAEVTGQTPNIREGQQNIGE